MGCDIFYEGSQRDPRIQEECIRFLRYCFDRPYIEVGAKTCSNPCLVVHRVKVRDGERPAALPRSEAVIDRKISHGEVIDIETHPTLPYFGIVPWSLEDLQDDPTNMGVRSHFVFQRPAGQLCSITMRDWFRSHDEWKNHLRGFLPPNLDEETQSQIVSISSPGGYWRAVGGGYGFFDWLYVIRSRYVPNLTVGDDYCIWGEHYERSQGILETALRQLSMEEAVAYLRSDARVCRYPGSEPSPAEQEVLEYLRAPNAAVRKAAIRALWRLRAYTCIPQVELHFKDADADVRDLASKAVDSLRKLVVDSTAQVASFYLRDEDFDRSGEIRHKQDSHLGEVLEDDTRRRLEGDEVE